MRLLQQSATSGNIHSLPYKEEVAGSNSASLTHKKPIFAGKMLDSDISSVCPLALCAATVQQLG
jgi:hypothetical protein